MNGYLQYPKPGVMSLGEDRYPYYLWPSGCGKTLQPTHTVTPLDPSSSVGERISLRDHETFQQGMESGVDVIIQPSEQGSEPLTVYRTYDDNNPYSVTGRRVESNVTDRIIHSAYSVKHDFDFGKPFSGIYEPMETTDMNPAAFILDEDNMTRKQVNLDLCCDYRFTPSGFDKATKNSLIGNDTFAKFKSMKWNLKLKSLKSEIEANPDSDISAFPKT